MLFGWTEFCESPKMQRCFFGQSENPQPEPRIQDGDECSEIFGTGVFLVLEEGDFGLPELTEGETFGVVRWSCKEAQFAAEIDSWNRVMDDFISSAEKEVSDAIDEFGIGLIGYVMNFNVDEFGHKTSKRCIDKINDILGLALEFEHFATGIILLQ